MSALLSLLVSLAGVVSCGGGGHAASTPARVWVDGPVRWLMTSNEIQTFRGLADDRAVLDFIESFWQRRNPDPGAQENPVREAFYERAAAADRLYAEAGRVGSLTARGRAMVLLGPPSVLKFRRQAVPAFDPHRHRGRPGSSTGSISVEVWEYALEDLAEPLAQALREAHRTTLVLSFMTEGERTTLLVGGAFLDRAPGLIAGTGLAGTGLAGTVP